MRSRGTSESHEFSAGGKKKKKKKPWSFESEGGAAGTARHSASESDRNLVLGS